MEEEALGALDLRALARDAAGLVRVPSITGDERAALERAEAAGLAADLHRHDLAALRAARRRLVWEGGAFAPGETPVDHPWVGLVRGALRDELGREAELAGVPWGADMRLFTARNIPTVMVGTTGIELAHAVDESVSLGELACVARTIIRAVLRWSAA